MASKVVFKAMEAADWKKVKELIDTTSWTPQDLEEQHGVRTELLSWYLKIESNRSCGSSYHLNE